MQTTIFQYICITALDTKFLKYLSTIEGKLKRLKERKEGRVVQCCDSMTSDLITSFKPSRCSDIQDFFLSHNDQVVLQTLQVKDLGLCTAFFFPLNFTRY